MRSSEGIANYYVWYSYYREFYYERRHKWCRYIIFFIVIPRLEHLARVKITGPNQSRYLRSKWYRLFLIRHFNVKRNMYLYKRTLLYFFCYIFNTIFYISHLVSFLLIFDVRRYIYEYVWLFMHDNNMVNTCY